MLVHDSSFSSFNRFYHGKNAFVSWDPEISLEILHGSWIPRILYVDEFTPQKMFVGYVGWISIEITGLIKHQHQLTFLLG